MAKNRAKGRKGQRRRARAQSRAVRGKLSPGIIQSWEDFDETAMAEYLEAVAEDFGEQLTAFEQALRCEN